MCVICIVRAGQNLPEKRILKAMHRANPHGMGFASKSLSYKGMNFERFYNRLQFVPINEDIIIHFRYATHGSVCVKNCHPFKKSGIWFAHNGILDITPEGDMTDSQTAFNNILIPTIKTYGIDSIELQAVIDDIIGYSKFAFLGKDGRVRLSGDFVDYGGYLCSNLNFVHRLNDFSAYRYRYIA